MKLYYGMIIICLFLASGCGETGPTTPPGKQIADRWCSECHGAPGAHPGHGNSPPVQTPNFVQIAQYPEINRQFLEKFFDGIIVMPIYSLSDTEKGAVLDYILSLKSSR